MPIQIAINNVVKGDVLTGGSPPPPTTYRLLAQNGDYLLAQNSDNLEHQH